MNKEFNEFELKGLGFISKSKTTVFSDVFDEASTLEETMTTKTVMKKLNGIVVKQASCGTGEGEVKISMYIPTDLESNLFNLQLTTFKDGIETYGQNSKHEPVITTALIANEDGDLMLKAYPNSIVKDFLTHKIENGSEETTQVEADISVIPDEYGNGMYRHFLTEEDGDDFIKKWMEEFNVKNYLTEVV